MASGDSTDLSLDQLRNLLAPYQQDHVLRWWGELQAAERLHLGRQIASINLPRLAALLSDAGGTHNSAPLTNIRTPPVQRLPESFEDWQREQEAVDRGEELLRAGKVAVTLVAGGQGSRLGHAGPKGTFPVGPVSGKSLFQLHAEKTLALCRRYEVVLPLLIMTSPENDAATREYFAEHRCFGLEPGQVVFFCQAMMPAVDRSTGRLLMTSRHELALSPNGHGGVLQALADGSHLAALAARGIEQLFYFQVDNPLVQIADPAFLGYHIQADSEISLKVLPKLGPAEKLGVVVQADGRLQLIEYSDLPRDLAERRTSDGQLEFWAGSIAIHVFKLSFLQRLAESGQMLPYHRAHKVVPFLDDSGQVCKPAQPNAVKFEMFVFDALPLARKSLVVETSRRAEFEPLKNAEGDNSPATVRQALARLYADWLQLGGVEVPRRGDGSPAVPIEICPLFALDAEELRAKYHGPNPVETPLYLEE